MPTKVEASYSRRMPIPGVKYAFDEYSATVTVDSSEPEFSDYTYDSLLREVRDAVDARYERDAADGLGLVEMVPETEPGAPAWAKQGPDPAQSDWARKWHQPEVEESATPGQLAYIENLYFDKIIPNNDERAMHFFNRIELGNLGKSEANACIEYLKHSFKWKPVKEQRGAAFRKGKKP